MKIIPTERDTMKDSALTTSQTVIDSFKPEQEVHLPQYRKALARRSFLKNVGLASAGIAAGAIIESCSSGSSTHAQAVPETDVLNFALNL